jgi:lipopolysaccharide transport system permease protein
MRRRSHPASVLMATHVASSSLPHRIVIRPAAGWTRVDLRELWEYRELLGFLIWRDVKVRYKQTVLGAAWAIVQPVASMVLFTILFGRIAKLPSEGVPYPLFVFAAVVPWQMFAQAFGSASNSVVGSAGLITKVYFPRLIVPLAAVCATVVDFLVAFAVLVLMMAAYGVAPGPRMLLTPFLVVFALTTAFAVALWSAALNVKYRDVQYVLPFVIQFWMLASPVAYSATLVERPLWRVMYALNPMVGVIQGFRWCLLGAAAPGPALAVSALMIILLLAAGLRYFRRMEDTFADII